jgi:hypothetical protein
LPAAGERIGRYGARMPLTLSLALASFIVDPGITLSFPPDDVELPANARPIVWLTAPAQGKPMSLVDGDGDAPATTPLDTALVVAPVLDGGTLTLAAVCEACDGDDVHTWRVNADDDVTPPAFSEPDAFDVSATAIEFHGCTSQVVGYEVRFDVPFVNEPHVLLVNGTRLLAGDGPYQFTVQGGSAREACFDVIAVDVAGNEGALAEPLCVTLDPANVEAPPSCAHHTSVLAFALLALASRRRATKCRGRAFEA